MAKRHTPKRNSKVSKPKPRILICTPEVTELPEGMGNAANYIRAKGGGLGDISAGLIRNLYEDDRFELHVALPKYSSKFADLSQIEERELDELTPVFHSQGIHLVNDSAFSRLDDLYDESLEHPRVRRAEAFSRHIINHLLDTVRPNVVHCNDWMTGLVPAAARERGIKSLFTLHNVFTEKDSCLNVVQSGIDVRRFVPSLYFERFPEETEENWKTNRIDFLATGIHASDIVNTVSKTFLLEIVDETFRQIIPESVRQTVSEKFRSGHACGILNAPNDSVDPRLSKHITPYYLEDFPEKKAENKLAFQKHMRLDLDAKAPLFFWPHRLYPQKGPELILAIAKSCITTLGIQLAFVANGDPDLQRHLESLQKIYQGRVAYQPFNEGMSELGKAASDFMLMPSQYEPCGLPQMECPRFGTLPVARLTGGISDTVTALEPLAGRGNGFPFTNYNASSLKKAITEALRFYVLPDDIRNQNIRRIMQESFDQFSLSNTAKEYIHIYEELMGI